MADTDPKVETTQVLREHQDETGEGGLCSCGWTRVPRPGAATPGGAQWRRHVVDQLDAAGLLTPQRVTREQLEQAASAGAAAIGEGDGRIGGVGAVHPSYIAFTVAAVLSLGMTLVDGARR